MKSKTDKQYIFDAKDGDNLIFNCDTQRWEITLDAAQAEQTVAPFDAVVAAGDGLLWNVYLWSVKYCRKGNYYKLEYKEY